MVAVCHRADAAGRFAAATFGAAGDGVTDDRAALQRALDAAEVSGGGTVTLCCGRTYSLDGPLAVPSHVELRGGDAHPCQQDSDCSVPLARLTVDRNLIELSPLQHREGVLKFFSSGDAGLIRVADNVVEAPCPISQDSLVETRGMRMQGSRSPARVVFVSGAPEQPGIPVAGQPLICVDGAIPAVGPES